MNLFNKISRQIYAINFNKHIQKDRILLLNQYNKFQIQYVVFLKFKKFIVIKTNTYDVINKSYGFNEDQIINIFSESSYVDIKNNKYLYSEYLQLNDEQLCHYFIDKVGMQIQQFQNYFKINVNKNKTFKYKNIVFTIYNNCIDYQDAKYCIDEILKIKYSSIFRKLKINFIQRITERDSNNVGGNIASNINGFNNIINITNTNILKSLFHQLGHIYQDIYFNHTEIQKLYDKLLDNQDNINVYGDYLFIEDQMIPQLFSSYYYNKQDLNKFTRDFIQKEILK